MFDEIVELYTLNIDSLCVWKFVETIFILNYNKIFNSWIKEIPDGENIYYGI